ncbi:MAG: aquaporin [Candidatus Eremiobacteraeota bacterium]|nr:aquaporin [Candidatus Eremiobacteraeota bacterium]
MAKKIAAELLGTFFVTLVATAVDVLYYTGAGVDSVSRWLARGFITTVLIYTFSETSGAHIDPAVSIGFAIRGVLQAGQLLAYVVAQFAGGFAAAALAFALWGHAVAFGASHPGPGYSHEIAFVTEVIVTFLLMLVILATAHDQAVVGKQAAIAVGLAVAACGFFAGPISGASMNPARSIPPQIFGGRFDIIWIYAFAPCIGAALAAIAAHAIFGPPKPQEEKAARGD